jgi:hypothetical protein
MPYIKISTQEYPFFEGDLQLENPTVTDAVFPDYQLVKETPYPDISTPSVITEGKPSFDGVNYNQVWDIRDATLEEIQIRTRAAEQRIAARMRQSM